MSVRVPARSCLVASFSILVPWLSAAPAFTEVPDCLVAEAHSVPSGDGTFNHSLTFTNGCPMRMYLTTRYAGAPYSGAPDPKAPQHVLGAGDTVTISLGYYQPTKAFRAQYEGRFARKSEASSSRDRVTRTVRTAASRPPRPAAPSRAKTPPRPVEAAKPSVDGVPLVELCRRAMRKIGTREGLAENDSKMQHLVEGCPSRVKRDPEKRRAELECVLETSPREDVGTCFVAH
ncbi:MAG: hypothetical protein FJ144_21175 [Deltaproteobacteria bacterium]|nr:hypothetical protein [Deltaproteobacteria bacterium]